MRRGSPGTNSWSAITLPTSVSAAWLPSPCVVSELGAHVHQCVGSMLGARPACRWLCVGEAAPEHAFPPCMFGRRDRETHAQPGALVYSRLSERQMQKNGPPPRTTLPGVQGSGPDSTSQAGLVPEARAPICETVVPSDPFSYWVLDCGPCEF